MALLESHGVAPTEDNAMHLIVFLEALKLYDERTASYGQIWRQYGALSNLLNAARKVDRSMETWWHNDGGAIPILHKSNLDDAFDALNYLAFFIRNAREGNLTGEQPDRPCEHPADAVMYNEFNKRTQCHRCGQTMYPEGT